MPKALIADPEKCNGCGLCRFACTIAQEHACDPLLSRIRVLRWNDRETYLPVVCQQCEDAPCMAVCPREAISRDPVLERMVIDPDRCISCRSCLYACPFGAIGFDPRSGKVFKCELCGGAPNCVPYCLPGALRFVDRRSINAPQLRRSAAQRTGVRKSGALAAGGRSPG